MSDLADAISGAVLAEADIGPYETLDHAAHRALISAAARAESEARDILRRAVEAARNGGASWAVIGAELGMSRQAAQQRFGAAETPAGPAERWLGPVTAFDEMAELDAAGRAGWRTVEAGMLAHRMIYTGTQWEHRRVLWRSSLTADEAMGWQVGCRAFPWIYLVRDLGIAAETTGTITGNTT